MLLRFHVNGIEAAVSADLGGSSKYSNETLKPDEGKGSMRTKIGHG